MARKICNIGAFLQKKKKNIWYNGIILKSLLFINVCTVFSAILKFFSPEKFFLQKECSFIETHTWLQNRKDENKVIWHRLTISVEHSHQNRAYTKTGSGIKTLQQICPFTENKELLWESIAVTPTYRKSIWGRDKLPVRGPWLSHPIKCLRAIPFNTCQFIHRKSCIKTFSRNLGGGLILIFHLIMIA